MWAVEKQGNRGKDKLPLFGRANRLGEPFFDTLRVRFYNATSFGVVLWLSAHESRITNHESRITAAAGRRSTDIRSPKRIAAPIHVINGVASPVPDVTSGPNTAMAR